MTAPTRPLRHERSAPALAGGVALVCALAALVVGCPSGDPPPPPKTAAVQGRVDVATGGVLRSERASAAVALQTITLGPLAPEEKGGTLVVLLHGWVLTGMTSCRSGVPSPAPERASWSPPRRWRGREEAAPGGSSTSRIRLTPGRRSCRPIINRTRSWPQRARRFRRCCATSSSVTLRMCSPSPGKQEFQTVLFLWPRPNF